MQDLEKKNSPGGVQSRLTASDHDRKAAGLLYVYPVVSRRAGGLSVGVNLNVNNACNWRCIYCQVPDLVRGAAPPVDLARLRDELRGFLEDVLQGDFLARRVEPDARRLNDIALSGNGEPTSAREFADVIELIGEVRHEAGVPEAVKTILITNGSLMHRPAVQAALAKLRGLSGEVWFKVDRAPGEGMRKVNDARAGLERVGKNLAAAAGLCPTWVQTCMFASEGAPPQEVELAAYLDFLRELLARGVVLEGVLLYSLARRSFQPEAERLQALPAAWLQAFGDRIRALGLKVRVTP